MTEKMDEIPVSGLTHRLMPDVGVLIVEPHGPLRAEDFQSIAATVDPWIEARGSLRGVIIHVAHFPPGWENFGTLLCHFRFVRDHHRKVQRVALAADGKFAELAPKIAEHFVQAELKHFDYDQFEEALAWVSAPASVEGQKD